MILGQFQLSYDIIAAQEKGIAQMKQILKRMKPAE